MPRIKPMGHMIAIAAHDDIDPSELLPDDDVKARAVKKTKKGDVPPALAAIMGLPSQNRTLAKGVVLAVAHIDTCPGCEDAALHNLEAGAIVYFPMTAALLIKDHETRIVNLAYILAVEEE